MNSISEDIKALLVAENYVFATNLFISTVPATVANCVTLFDTSSTPPDGTFDGKVFFNESFQIIVKNVSYPAAHTVATNLINLLNNKTNFTINGSHYLAIMLVNGPNLLTMSGVESNKLNGTLLSINFRAIRKQI